MDIAEGLGAAWMLSPRASPWTLARVLPKGSHREHGREASRDTTASMIEQPADTTTVRAWAASWPMAAHGPCRGMPRKKQKNMRIVFGFRCIRYLSTSIFTLDPRDKVFTLSFIINCDISTRVYGVTMPFGPIRCPRSGGAGPGLQIKLYRTRQITPDSTVSLQYHTAYLVRCSLDAI